MRLTEWLKAAGESDPELIFPAAARFLESARTRELLGEIAAADAAERLGGLGIEFDHVGFSVPVGSLPGVERAAAATGFGRVEIFPSRVMARELGVEATVFRAFRGSRAVEVFIPLTPAPLAQPHLAFAATLPGLEPARRELLAAGFALPAFLGGGVVRGGDGTHVLYFDRPGLRVEVFAPGVL